MFQPTKQVSRGKRKLNQPLGGNDFPFPGGFNSFMRLPIATSTDGLNACIVGVPMDNGTSYRPGARFAPREIRNESVILRPCNPDTGADPFNSLMVADIGDVPVNMYNAPASCVGIRKSFDEIIKNGCVPISIGGDHTISYPILQSMAAKYGPIGLVYVDAHSDCADLQGGEKIGSATPIRRAVEENLIDCKRVVEIGQRGARTSTEPYKYEEELGFRIVPAMDCWHKSLTPLMSEVRLQLGDGPVYFCFDIDALDPAYAPGTGFREIGGLTSIQAIEIIRGCKGLNIVGLEMSEVLPAYDMTGMTSLTAAKLIYEMLCVIPGVEYKNCKSSK